jgi:PAS domain S-box-containing protein
MSHPTSTVGGVRHPLEPTRGHDAVRATEALKAAMLDAALDCIVTIDCDGRITEFNRAAEQTFGYTRLDVLGRELAEVIIPPSLREAHRRGLARYLATGDAHVLGRRIEMTAIRADGSEFLAELAITRLPLDGPPAFMGCLRDITRQRHAEEALHRSESYLAQGQRRSQTGVWVWDPFTDHHFASAEAYRLFGFTVDETAATSRQHFPLRVHPDDRQRFEDAIARARRELTDFEASYRVVQPDGDVRHMHAIGHPVLHETGKVREFIGTVVDVTEQRRAEETRARQVREAALRAEISAVLTRADTLRALLQGCTDALVRRLGVALARIWTLRKGSSVLELEASSGLYTHVDGAHGRVAVGELKIGLIAQERRPHLTNDVQNDPRISDKAWAAREGMVAFAGYPLIVEERVTGVVAMFSRSPLAPDTIETLELIADSIAQGIERKRADDELRRSEAYLAEGQRLSHTGSWAWNPATGALFWSKEMYRIYGFDPDEGPPPYDVLLTRVHPADSPAANRTAEESVRDLREFDMGYRVRRPDGSVTHIRTVGHPVLDRDGKLVEFIGTVVDVTERKKSERRLRRAIRARYQAVLAERMRLARDMHDGLLQDVTGIALQLRAVLPHVRATPNAAAETLDRILELADRTSREAREAVAGIRSGGRSDDFAAALESAARQAAAGAPVVCSLVVTGRPRSVRRNVEDAVVRLVREAVTNVVKHADARTVTLLLAFRARRFRVSVTDDGKGFSIPPDHGAPAGHFGLIGMRERADGVGASLSVRSAPGQGTTVVVEAPYRQ